MNQRKRRTSNRRGVLYYLWTYVKRGKRESASVLGNKGKEVGKWKEHRWLGDEEERDRLVVG